MKTEKIVSRIAICWITTIIVAIGILYKYMDETESLFYRFGPHENFIVVGIKINTIGKYLFVVSFCFINSLMRNNIHNILNSWLINNVQDIKLTKPKQIKLFAYEVTYVITIYTWVDWYMYMNILLAQVDMLIAEILADILISGLITKYYLNATPVIQVTQNDLTIKNQPIEDISEIITTSINDGEII